MVKIIFTLKSDSKNNGHLIFTLKSDQKGFHDKKLEVYKGFSIKNLNIFSVE